MPPSPQWEGYWCMRFLVGRGRRLDDPMCNAVFAAQCGYPLRPIHPSVRHPERSRSFGEGAKRADPKPKDVKTAFGIYYAVLCNLLNECYYKFVSILHQTSLEIPRSWKTTRSPFSAYLGVKRFDCILRFAPCQVFKENLRCYLVRFAYAPLRMTDRGEV